MTTLQFCLSLTALLFAPGPTNALLALSGAEAGAWRTLRLLPLVVAAYAMSVLPLAALGEEMLRQQHWLRAGVTLAAAAWVAWLAFTLWHRSSDDARDAGAGRGARLFVTTLLNPKGFIIGLVLVPSQPSQAAALALFFAVLALAAAAWAMLGTALQRTGGGNGLPLLRRVCAGWLGLLALLLGSAALSA